MNKKKFLMMLLITFASFCLGVSGVRALPTCNFNNYGTLELRTQKEVNFWDLAHKSTIAMDFNDNKTDGFFKEDDERKFYYVYAWNGGYINSAKFTIYSGVKESKAQCEYSVDVAEYCKKIEGEHCETFKFWFILNKKEVQKIVFEGTYFDPKTKEIKDFTNDDFKSASSASHKSTKNSITILKSDDGSGVDHTEGPAYEVESKHIDSGDEKKNKGTGTAGVAKATKRKSISSTKTDKDGNIIYNFETDRKTNCSTIKNLIHDYWKYVMVIVPILLIIMMSIDFFKAMASSDADAIKKSITNTVKRTIAAVVLLALPALLSFILGLFGLELCV